MKNPFFIFGCKRGGTTMLRLMINSHSLLGVPPESHFLLPIINEYKKLNYLSSEEKCKRIYDLIVNGGRFNTWQTTNDELERIILKESNSNYAIKNIIDRLFFTEIQKYGKVRWGDKTPEYIDICNEIMNVFDRSKFIFIVRDGRDVSKSLKDRGWEGWSIYQRSRYWSRCTKKAISHMKNPNVLIVKYEDLVLEPKESLIKITSFLGEHYEDTMEYFHEDSESNITAVERKNKIHTKLSRKPSPKDIFKWKDNQNKKQVFLFEAISHNELVHLGYEVKYYNSKSLLHNLLKIGYIFYGVIIKKLYEIYHNSTIKKLTYKLKASSIGMFLKKYVRNT